MSASKSMAQGKRKLLEKWFPTISEVKVKAATETLGILTDVEQVTHLLASLEDLRHGRIVKADNAFEDL